MAPTTNTTIHSVHISNVTINVSAPSETAIVRTAFNPTTVSDAPDVCSTGPATAQAEEAPAARFADAADRKTSSRSRSTSRSRKR